MFDSPPQPLPLPVQPGVVITHDEGFARAEKAVLKFAGRLPDCPEPRQWRVVVMPTAPDGSPVENADRAWAAGTKPGCDLQIIPWVMDLTVTQRCMIGYHEIMHNLGYGHMGEPDAPPASMNPNGIMNPVPDLNYDRFPGCNVNVNDGRTRSQRNTKDRHWCYRHLPLCQIRYPNLFNKTTEIVR